MRTKFKFDQEMDSTEVFRILINSVANPGRKYDISKFANMFQNEGDWYSLAMTLLDGEVEFFWSGEEAVKEEISFLTGSVESAMESADYLFISESVEPKDLMEKVKIGTHENPHDSATVILKTNQEPTNKMIIHGPGIPLEGRSIEVNDEELGYIEARNAMDFEYPCGIDLMFLRHNGDIITITRKVR